MRILVLSNEVWNDKINGNNVTSNWFEGMNAEFANVFASPGEPYNGCCKSYFQITDRMMMRSILTKSKAGRVLPICNYNNKKTQYAEVEPKLIYLILKTISCPLLRLIREIIWLLGEYNIVELKSFIANFKPDVVFSERKASCKMLRLEKIVRNISNVPLFAFTGDDEYSLKQISFSPFFWVNRFMVRYRLRENAKYYKVYYTLSEEQGNYYEKVLGCKCKLLYKCGNFTNDINAETIHDPIRMVYAGKLYCNRWKMLGDIVDELKQINKDSIKIVLDIYTKDKITNRQLSRINDEKNAFVRGSISQGELKDKYNQADIALHVESVDLKNRLITKYSFSTKIIDCIFSGCAVLAYCWNQHSGYTYLKKRDAAICVSDRNELKKVLNRLCTDSGFIKTYMEKARACGEKYHKKDIVQQQLLMDFNEWTI